MRQLPLLSAAVIGLGLIAFTAPAAAFTNSSPAGLRAGTPGLDAVEPVHCRRYVHRHRLGHGTSRGCHAGVVVIERDRPSVVVRERSRTHIRSGTTVRGSGSVGTSTTIRSGSGSGSAPAAGTSTTIKSGSGRTPAATTGAAPAPAATQSAPAAKQSAPEAKPSAPAATQSAPSNTQSAPAGKQ